jgi:hypothetical protein
MGYYLYDVNGYVGNLATNTGLEELATFIEGTDKSSVKELFRTGSVDASDMLYKEVNELPTGSKVIDNFKLLVGKCKDVIIITDGVGIEEEEVKEEKKAIQEQIINSIRIGIERALKGGPGSGNFDHAGRPGKVGGSATGRGEDIRGPILPPRIVVGEKPSPHTYDPGGILGDDGQINIEKYKKLNGKEKALELEKALGRYTGLYVPPGKAKDKSPEWKDANEKIGVLERIRRKVIERFVPKAKEAGKERLAKGVGLDRRKGMRAALIFQVAGLQLELKKRRHLETAAA